jgi:glycerol-3-phosphate O-acyltransferase
MATGVSATSQPVTDAPWPAAGESDVVVLRFASTPAERSVLDAWLERAQPEGVRVQAVDADAGDLERALTLASGDPLIVPVRVAWLPRERAGARTARLRDILALRNPRRPDPRTQERILRNEPDRCRVTVAEPATASDLIARLRRSAGLQPLPDFVRRQAVLALDRTERSLIGTQYKVPRFVSEEISSSARFRAGVAELAERLERPDSEVAEEAAAYIDEMVASVSQTAIDAWAGFGRWLSRAYTVDIDTSRLDELRELNARHPLVFLPSHRSYLDPLVLRKALFEHAFPPNHTMGGINVAFWPIGPWARRSGYVFIRRSFRDNAVYKFALRQYMAFLLRKRFNMEWYIEGGRSRTGKLRPPRFGLLSYLVDAFHSGGVDDAYLVPVSIVYDQLYEVGAMAAEEHGAQKTAESLSWLVGYARAQGRGFGKVHVAFGDPVSLRGALDAATAPAPGGNGADPAAAASSDLSVEKVAFEVCHRIGRATPITPNAVVTLTLLGVENRALTLGEVRQRIDPMLDYVATRGFPTMGDPDLRRAAGLRSTLDSLARHGVVTCFSEGIEPVWGIGSDRHLEAAFYRNAAVHFFVNRAIAELVLARIAEGEGPDLRAAAVEHAEALRDLLKFEFFFAGRDEFARDMRAEMTLLAPDWEQRPAESDEARAVLEGAPVHIAHRVLRAFLEAYAVVAERLATRDPRLPVEEKAFLDECLGAARQYRLQRRLHSPESISKELFGNALKLAANRDLVDAGREDLLQRRREFAAEIGDEVRRISLIRDLAMRELAPTSFLEPWPAE